MLTDAVIFLAAAVVAVPVFKRFGLGSVTGYLAAGAIIGPSGFGLIHQVHDTLEFAEFGVVLLLFLIGLELQPTRLWKARGGVFGLGGAQFVITAVVIACIALAFGARGAVAWVLGLGLAISSTAFALQLLSEKNELTTTHGRAAFGILLFQDLAAIPTLAFVPLLASGVDVGDGSAWLRRLPLIIGVLLGMALAGRYLVRPVFRFIAAARSQELSVFWALLVVVGAALIMDSIGWPMALGAFIAGVMLADSEYRHELEANIEPFKGLLLGLFFVAVGMSANLQVAITRPLDVVAIVLGMVVIKVAILYGIAKATRHDNATSFSLAIVLSQGGEFAFVIFSVARQARVLGPALADLLVVSVTLSMALTPLLFVLRDRLATLWKRHQRRDFDTIADHNSRVIIAGFGRFGQIVARVLRSRKISFTALEISTTQVDFVRRFGNLLYYGDASRVDLLRAAGADRAELFVLAIDDPDASVRTAKTVLAHFPTLKILARARNRQHAFALLALGIPTVIRETFFSGLEMSRVALEELGLTGHEALDTVHKFQEYDEDMVLRQYEIRDDEKALIDSALQAAEQLERLFEQDASNAK